MGGGREREAGTRLKRARTRLGQGRREFVLTITLFGSAPRVPSRRINCTWLNSARPPGKQRRIHYKESFKADVNTGESSEGCERREILQQRGSLWRRYILAPECSLDMQMGKLKKVFKVFRGRERDYCGFLAASEIDAREVRKSKSKI